MVIEHFQSCDQWPYWFTKTKDDFCIKIEFKSPRNGFVHQYGRCFFVLGHQSVAAVTSYENALFTCT